VSDLLLCGGGHAHLFVLDALARARSAGVRVTLVSPQRRHLYSGMLPGLIGGRYTEDEVSLDLAQLAAAAGAQFVESPVTAFSAADRVVTTADGRVLHGDVVSLAIGSLATGPDVPGVAMHALTAKPIQQALAIAPALDAAAAAARGPVRVVVVGGGAAGCELAWAACARLRARGREVQATIVEHAATLLADRRPGVQRAAMAACARLGVAVLTRSAVQEMTAYDVGLTDGRRVPADLALWVAGSRAAPLLAASGLACDARGYVQVDAALRSVSHPQVFAAGDAATPIRWPATPKAGVYAVRAGPILAANLLAAAQGATPAATWAPQREFLALLNTGDGRAILSWRSLVAEGAWAMRLKDRIDRGFLARFQALGAPSR
jgi:selenide,water dikinase